jgi:hypothetical protein
VLIRGIVDSGADRTVLPLSLALRLGVAHLLDRTPEVGLGLVGRAFPLWSASSPLHGWVVRADGSAWGPRFRLRPLFADADVALLGRADFFRAFTITFQEHAEPPVYSLEAA